MISTTVKNAFYTAVDIGTPDPQRVMHPVCTFVGALVSLGNNRLMHY